MSSDKVRQTPIDEQIQFLRTKGLTDDEIREAQTRVLRSAPLPPVNSHQQPMLPLPPPPASSSSTVATIQNVANTVVLVCGLSYAGYRLVRVSKNDIICVIFILYRVGYYRIFSMYLIPKRNSCVVSMSK